MEGSPFEHDQFRLLTAEFEPGPEQILSEAFAKFEATQTNYLESLLLCAKNQGMAIGRDLINLLQNGMTAELGRCMDIINSVEPATQERMALVTGVLLGEDARRVAFMNANRAPQGREYESCDEEAFRAGMQETYGKDNPEGRLQILFYKSLVHDSSEFLKDHRRS